MERLVSVELDRERDRDWSPVYEMKHRPSGMEKLGILVGKFPLLSVLVGVVICCVCMTGLLQLTFSEDPDQFVPVDAPSLKDRYFLEDNYGPQSRIATLLYVVTDGTTVYNHQSEVQEQYDKIMSLPNTDQVVLVVPAEYYVDFQGPVPDPVGVLSEGATNTSDSEVLRIVWILNGDADALEMTEEWEEQFMGLNEGSNSTQYKGMTLYPTCTRQFSDVFGAEVQGDVVLVGASLMVIFAYSMIVVGWGRQMVSFVGVVCVGAGMGIGLGLASWVGFFFEDIPSFWGNLHSVLPFLLLGIGVDDMFVMADAYAVADAELGEDKGDEDEGFFKSITSFSFADPLSVRVEKMRRTYNEAGRSIFVTSITSAVAFGVGVSSSIPSISSFNLTSMFSVAGIFCMVVLVVGPALLFVCCCRSCKPTELSEQEDEKEGMWEKYFGGVEEVDKKKKGQRRVAWFLEYKFAPKLIKFRYIVWALFLIWYGIAIWLVVAKLDDNATLDDFIPKDSDLYETNEVNKKYFPDTGATAYLYLGEIDYIGRADYLDGVTDQITNYTDLAPYLVPNNQPYSEWWPLYRESGMSNLTEWVLLPQNQRFSESFAVQNGVVVSSRFAVIPLIPMDTAEAKVNSMNACRDVAHSLEIHWTAFSYSPDFIEWDQIAVIGNQLMRNLILSVLAIGFITMYFLGNIRVGFIVTSLVVLTEVSIVAFMPIWGIKLDTVSSVYLVIAIGLAVDYSLHIAHAFVYGDPPSAIEALGQIGGSVLNGATTTILAILVLGFSTSYVFVVFFRQMLSLTIFALLHGFILLPTLL